MKRDVAFVLKIMFYVFLIAVPYICHVAIKSSVENKGREIKKIESQILTVKKEINNLERVFSERIDYKKVEKKAKRMGFNYINLNNNKVYVVKE